MLGRVVLEPIFLIFCSWGCVCIRLYMCLLDSLRSHGLQPARLLCPWSFLGKSTWVGCHFLLQGLFPTQGPNRSPWCRLHWQVDSLLPVPGRLPTSAYFCPCLAWYTLKTQNLIVEFCLFSSLSVKHNWRLLVDLIRFRKNPALDSLERQWYS